MYETCFFRVTADDEEPLRRANQSTCDFEPRCNEVAGIIYFPMMSLFHSWLTRFASFLLSLTTLLFMETIATYPMSIAVKIYSPTSLHTCVLTTTTRELDGWGDYSLGAQGLAHRDLDAMPDSKSRSSDAAVNLNAHIRLV